jgi:ABC-2 type transport system permease protein
MAYFVAGGAGFGLIDDTRNGVVERLQVTPLRRAALVLGPAGRDATTIGVQSLLLLGLGWLTGLRISWSGAVIAIAMVCLLAVALSSLSRTIAHAMGGDVHGFAALFNGLSIPVLLLSGVLLPLTLAPRWLDIVAYANPLRYSVEAARDLVAGDPGSVDAIRGLAISFLLAAAVVALAIRHFRRGVA